MSSDTADATPAGDGHDDIDVRDGDISDVLPDDLDLQQALTGDYVFPNNNRRRVPGALYVLIAAVIAVIWLLVRSDTPILFNQAIFFGALGLLAIGLFHLLTGWNLNVDERDALVAATKSAGFPGGHASAQMGWRGWLSRPTWRILLYSNEAQPLKRGLVLVDGVDGDVLDTIVEDNPEDWTELNS